MTDMTPIDTNCAKPAQPTVSKFTFEVPVEDKDGWQGGVSNYYGIRTVIFPHAPNDPWFVAADVCKALGLKSPWTAYNRMAEDEMSYLSRTVVGMRPGKPMVILAESGLYKLIMRSDKPEAKHFQDWVTRDVLPAIRKDGMYVKGEEKVASGEMSLEEMTLKVLEGLQAKVTRLATENAEMKPKADGYDSFLDSEGSFTATQAAHMLRLKRPHTAHQTASIEDAWSQISILISDWDGIRAGSFKTLPY